MNKAKEDIVLTTCGLCLQETTEVNVTEIENGVVLYVCNRCKTNNDQ